jgi:alpha-ketoglutarate-dependent taurine dioxygenase
MALTTVDLTPRTGSEIKIDKKNLLGGSAAAEIHDLLERRGIVIFRGMDFDDSDLTTFAATMGTILVRENQGTKDNIVKVTFDKGAQQNQYGGYFRGTFYWHMDEMARDIPPFASILSPRVLSPTGGETEFVNTFAAYEDLPAAEKKALEGIQVVHSVTAAYRKFTPNPTEAQLEAWRSKGAQPHPLVWTHRSGRKSLVNGQTTDYVVGMDRAEGDALLKRLLDFATQPQYVYQHKWQMGDVLMWDNTSAMHRVLPFDETCGRRLHRVTLVGEAPLSAAA